MGLKEGPARFGTTRLFVLGVISLFALLVMHNALNIDIAQQTVRRPPAAFPSRRVTKAPHVESRAAGGGAQRALAASGLSVKPSVADEPPWTTAISTRRVGDFNYSDCSARPGTLGPTRRLDYIVSPDDADGFPANCEREELKELCAVVKRVAIKREVLTAVCNSKIIGQLEMFLKGVEAAGIKNVMIIALDQKLCDWLDQRGVAYYKKISTAAGSHKISAQKFRIVKEFLSVGCSVLMSDVDMVWLRNPFTGCLWRDTDLEGATDGWDAETAYGWTERLEDVTTGGSPVEGYRITAFNSGLWYLQSTQAGLRMMTLLAHRMETEDTWDQTAFSQESSLPTHDSWLSAGPTVRVMNHLCFCNSKTLLRAIRPSRALASHRPVVVHVNYHQNKQAYMVDIHERYHKGVQSALDKTARDEPRELRTIKQVEAPFWLELNDGFVSGAHIQPSVAIVTQHKCGPAPPQNAFLKRTVELLPPRFSCESSAEQIALCAKLAEVAPGGEVALVIVTRENARALPIFAEAARLAGVRNILLLAAEGAGGGGGAAESPAHAAQDCGLPWLALSAALPSAALAALPAHALKWAALHQVLLAGVSALLLEPSVVLLSDPFLAFYRDSDVEAMSAGWDEPSAYGYNHVLDDETMGFTRFCHGSRIVGKESGLLFAQASADAARLAWTLVKRMREQPDKAERELLSEELWLPSQPAIARAGVTSRVLDYLCFASAKVLWRTINRMPRLRAAHSPVAVALVQSDPELLKRMQAVVDRYHKGTTTALDSFPSGGQLADFSHELCEPGQHLAPVVRGSEWLQRVSGTAWTWSGVKEVSFDEDGTLRTPWGKGTWKVVSGKENMLAATFISRVHILQFTWKDGRGQFLSSRCDDADVVLGRALQKPPAAAA